MEKNDIVVCIPVYKEHMTGFEQASLRQCFSVLRDYCIVLVMPRQLNVDEYEHCAICLGIDLGTVEFEETYFEGIQGYNNLCLSEHFYRAFAKFKYMLIYQLDAWVFRDELLDWSKKGFDYIGAPWNDGFKNLLGQKMYIGNGGLSLRRISSFLRPYSWLGFRHVWSISQCLSGVNPCADNILKRLLMCFGYKNTFCYLIKHSSGYLEDVFWSAVFDTTNFKKRKPKIEDARAFAFEGSPSLQFVLNGSKLPFGCHAFEKNEYQTFWINYIKYDN